jgi:radical SAM superfamily enzyme YgiQ (UPF0313 family)
MQTLLTHAYFLAADEKEQAIMRPYPPLGILSIAAYLEERGAAVEVFDTTFSTPDAFRAMLLEKRPDVIGMYTNLMTRPRIVELLHFIRSRGELDHTKVVLGGPEVTHHVEKFLHAGADAIVIGEGEETMYELVRAWETGMPPGDVAGIAYRDDTGEIQRTPARMLLKQIDELPMPKRDAIDLTRYLDTWKKHHGMNAVSISTMRGCPFSCRWCSRAVYGDSYRRRSPARVADEMQHIHDNYHPDTLWFVDDVFTINHRWLEEFAAELKRRGLKIPYECITRADRLNEKAVALLKESGCFRVWIGAESGSQKILDAMDRRVTVDQVREMIHLSKQYGIETGTFIMLGYPGETEEDIVATIDHQKRSNPDHYTVTVAYPIAGTPFFDDVQTTIVNQLPWETSTDRDIEIARPYSKRYYQFAMSRVFNEVALHRMEQASKQLSLRYAKHRLKAMAAKAGMQWERRK